MDNSILNIIRTPDEIWVSSDSSGLTRESNDIKVRYVIDENKLKTYVSAQNDNPRFICLRWNCKTFEPVKVLGDCWERSYSDLMWHGINPDLFMPWYFLVKTENKITGCGVMVQPNSFVSFEYDKSGVTAWIDVRCGSVGVHLNGRELLAATFVCESYYGISAFDACCDFCKVMSPNPILPNEPVYGSNNWYYAYGESSKEEILEDAEFLADLTQNIKNRPFMVIDDGWTDVKTHGPWIPNSKFGDMSYIADEFKRMGVKPGLWLRLLSYPDEVDDNPDWYISRGNQEKRDMSLDPSHPEVQNYLRRVLQDVRSWGYELIKHDFSTYDLFGDYGKDLNGLITNKDNWSFYDKTKTSAEIVLDFYRLIREETPGMYIIGCNTISHLCAGLVEINRIGDDTSGKSWGRTRSLGINTLAFRLPQNKNFYMVDADCVGILKNYIPWDSNKKWLKLLAYSGSPLFVSCDKKSVTDEMSEDIKNAFIISSFQKDKMIPLDWEYNKIPAIWSINGETVEFDWLEHSFPLLQKSQIPSTESPDWL